MPIFSNVLDVKQSEDEGRQALTQVLCDLVLLICQPNWTIIVVRPRETFSSDPLRASINDAIGHRSDDRKAHVLYADGTKAVLACGNGSIAMELRMELRMKTGFDGFPREACAQELRRALALERDNGIVTMARNRAARLLDRQGLPGK